MSLYNYCVYSEGMPVRMPYQTILDEFVDITRQIIADKLTGIYLHGSMAMGCFHPAKSDIDLIVVVEEGIFDIQKMQFMEQVVRLNGQAPPKGLELSVVKRKYCKPFAYPTPFELHFSPAHLEWFKRDPQDYVQKMNGTDIDLAAHFTVINRCGIVLYGEQVDRVFGTVPPEDYADSICADIEHAREDMAGDPLYITLNLCRVLAFLEDGLCLSKEEGAEWALNRADLEYKELIAEALMCYRTDREMSAKQEIAGAFVEDMLRLISGKRAAV